MQTTAQSPSSPKMSLRQRNNFRMIAVVGVVLFLVGYPIYTYLTPPSPAEIETPATA